MFLLDAHCSVIAVNCVVLSGAQLFLVLTEQLAVCRREIDEGVDESQGRTTIMIAMRNLAWRSAFRLPGYGSVAFSGLRYRLVGYM